jgi:poly-gamma-glutamate synthesis protein (capsule biosynthesis protein)
MHKLFKYLGFLIYAIIFFSCSTTKKVIPTSQILDSSQKKITETPTQEEKRIPLVLTFCGDLMCHDENANTTNFSDIYKDIEPIILFDSFTFANLETPINNDLPYSGFPAFNVKSNYIDAAIKAGIDVFSIANNHTNDGNLASILTTAEYFNLLKKQGIYFAGIHTGKGVSETNTQPAFKSDGLSFQIIEKDGWRILFAAYTQILNNSTALDYIDYYPNTKTENDELKKQLINLKNTYKHDIFILSVHCNEPEYVIEVPQAQKEWYTELRNCGVDIIWANHPHVLQEWESYDNNQGNCESVVMYSLGNLISGQRRPWPNTEHPEDILEYTGDSVLMQMTIVDNVENQYDNVTGYLKKKSDKTFKIQKLHPIYITTHITKWHGDYLIKQLTPEFIATMPEYLQKYYTKRLELIKKIKGTVICQ